ncbi:protein kinase [Gemmatirosa kalamazoonensis]|uniref:non-specific serine/threonine protein kinase n=1 Tax=Gemmatirosa kalamazoonensis TaxID=861299 RepID=W0RFU3_9BACT|nr:serine/threonine-protein kinase [Gemmatirosa kalamazoonensis]AHG89297.1 protein kinase [Gemmatirosa kalamazoonensis]
MTDALRQALQSSLGTGFLIERELGGGGMSRVFVAHDDTLGRRVVVKVLSPELSAALSGALSVERFEREIRTAARLQHPHVVAVLTAGATAEGLPYFTMPFVEGESLRHRLVREGRLPVDDAVAVLRDVAKALAYAHERGVVHRDVKPDNVLLSGGAAVVTDFGIAKALSAAAGNGAAQPSSRSDALTQLGVALGTPAYMAPEQAAGDPDVDHRADLYALGCVAFELLAGRPPFGDRPPRRALAAHLTEPAPDVRGPRPDTPPALADLVARLLAKDAAARPQSAADVLRALDRVTPGGAASDPMPLGTALRRALAVYAAAFVVVAALARTVVATTGVPDWVFPGALLLAALGLPALLATAYVQHAARRAPVSTPSTLAAIAVRAGPHVSWRRTARWSASLLGVFAAVVGGVMALRAMGVGPARSLLAAGAIEARAPIVVTDFTAVGDTSLGPVLAEAVRSDLEQSNAVRLLGPDELADALRRMQRPPGTRVDLALARELAQREGFGAIVDGAAKQLGTTYLLTLRLVSADSGRELAAYHETASDAAQLIPTLGRMTRRLRGRMGESLKAVRESQPLEQATTTSLPALRKYTEAIRERGRNQTGRAVTLLREAIALDTGFVSAYARLGAYITSVNSDVAQAEWAVSQAFARRDRLPEAERLLVEQYYYGGGPPRVRDAARVLRAAEEGLALRPHDWYAVQSVAMAAANVGDLRRADSLLRRAIELQGSTPSLVAYGNLANVMIAERRAPSAVDSIYRVIIARFPDPAVSAPVRVSLAYLRGDYAGASDAARAQCAARITEPRDRESCAGSTAAEYELALGHVREFERGLGLASTRARNVRPLAAIVQAARLGAARAWVLGDRAGAARLLDSALVVNPLDSLPEANRPYPALAWAYAATGRADRAATFLAAAERRWAGATDAAIVRDRAMVRAVVALGAGRAREAIPALAAAAASPCGAACRGGAPFGFGQNPHALLAYAYDLAGRPDSALASYERFIEVSHVTAAGFNLFAAGSWKRIGELAEATGDVPKAIAAYERFVTLWKDADPELQPKVREVRDRLARLRAREARRR